MNRHTLATSTLLGLAVTFATTLPQIGFAQTNPVVGMWKLNLANSTFNPGPPPRSQTAIVQTEGQGLKITLEGIDAQGNPAKAVIVNFNDGKSHPVTGFRAYDAQSDKVITDSTAWLIRTKAGKVVQTLVSEVSADGKTWTVTVAGVTPNGQQLYNVLVREKQ
jgi:hypothetical protein